VDMNLRCFTYKELVEATDGFKEKLGKGAFGVVYKGVIQTGSTVLAVNGGQVDTSSSSSHVHVGNPFWSCSQPPNPALNTLIGPLPRWNRWTSTFGTFVFTVPEFLVGSVRGGEPSVLETKSYQCRISSKVPVWAMAFELGRQRSSWAAYGNNGIRAFLWCFEEIRVDSQVFCSNVEEIR